MPTTVHHIKVTWPNGASTEWTTTGAITFTSDGEEVTFTDELGHTHKIRRKNTGDIEQWDTTAP